MKRRLLDMEITRLESIAACSRTGLRTIVTVKPRCGV